MSDGKCGMHKFENIDRTKIDDILDALKHKGMSVRGDNPWDIDTHNHGVKLRGTWDPGTEILAVIVTDKSFIALCSKIWDAIDPLIHHVAKISESYTSTTAEGQPSA